MGTGAISKNSVASATINTGENVQLMITADKGYVLKTLYVDGTNVTESVDEDGIYTITAISKNMSVSATFEEQASLEGDVNKDGEVNISQSVPIITSTASDLSSITTTRSSVSYQDIGIRLLVKPLVGKDGTIQLDIDQSVD